MEKRSLQAFLILAAALLVALPASGAADNTRPRVLAVVFDNDVNPVTKDFVNGAIERANDEDYDAILIELDTPGGLSSSMEAIYKKELASEIPVIVYVSPDGARAASAGVWIGQAADVLAMAPQTNIGSSTPIGLGGEDIPADARRKVINDAAKSLRALAEEHGRNGDWAERAVRQAANLTAREALDQDVIDVIAPDVPTLLDRIDGRTTRPKDFVLRTADANVERIEMGLWKRILDTLIDPEIIVLMFSIGLLGIIVELWNPGLIFPGTVGAISLIIGLYGVQVLPISWAGLLLMLLAAAFIAAEPFVPSHGALSVAGAVCFVLGALLLFEPAGPLYEVSVPFVLGLGGTIAVMTGLLVFKIVQIRQKPVEVGVQSVVGARGHVRRAGYVFVNGELWRALPEDGDLRPGEQVEVTRVEDGLVLRVRPVREAEPVT